jgi:hypothetical protein
MKKSEQPGIMDARGMLYIPGCSSTIKATSVYGDTNQKSLRTGKAPSTDVCPEKAGMFSRNFNPARVKIRSPVAGMAGRRETEYLKPIDKAIRKGCERVTGP